MNIAEFVANSKVRLTPAQKRIVRYLVDNMDESVFLTAAQLAQKAETSEASVVRLAQALGFNGYPGLQKMFREGLQDRLSTVTRLERSVEHAGRPGEVLAGILQEDIRNITNTLHDIPLETFEQAARELYGAKRIFVAGLRGAHAPAVILSTYLRFLRKETYLLVPGHGEVWDVLHNLTDTDLVLGISFPRYTRFTVELLEHARRKGARIGAITDSQLSPLAVSAHWILTAQCRLDSFIESFTAATSLINALLTAVSLLDPRDTKGILEEREALWEEKGMYVT